MSPDWVVVSSILGSVAVVGTGGAVIFKGGKWVSRVDTAIVTLTSLLNGHVEREESDRQRVEGRLDNIERKLPNGELKEMLELVRKLKPASGTKTGRKRR